jgi:formylglycine-generating enzyme required for sulfatase activity
VSLDPTLRRECRDGTFRDENQAVETPAPPSPSTCPPGMAALPAGTFFLKRIGEISVTAFCLDLTEVTVADYAACVLERRCSTENVKTVFWDGKDQGESACNYGVDGRGQHPMNCVDWMTADTYCRARGKRLPSEIEWEWAAVGGDQNRYHPWGEEARDGRGCWFDNANEPRRKSTCEVGSFPSGNARFGHRDLAGNVWEWTNTLLDAPCPERVVRGGHQAEPPTFRSSALGFRCAQ